MTMAGTILLVSEGEQPARQLQQVCDSLKIGMTHVETMDEALAFFRSGTADLVLANQRTFGPLREQRPGIPSILLCADADSRQTIEAMKQGELDCLVPPFTHEELRKRLAAALRLVAPGEQVPPKKPRPPFTGTRLAGQSPAMQEVYKQIGSVAAKHINVLVTGESGTGKELVARAIHEHSDRYDMPFLAINCAAIPETLLESELVGHERGAFSDATGRRVGKFEQCDGGTLMLDEIGDMPVATQSKVLRVLQGHRFQRVGGTKEIACDVRIVAATHQPLEVLIEQGRFRKDLYYRIKVATIHVPPLRDREVDAVLLGHDFVSQFNPQMDTQIRTFHSATVAALLAYPWPGNVRELENTIKVSLLSARGQIILKEFLPEHIQAAARESGAKAPAKESGGAEPGGGGGVLARWAAGVVRERASNGDGFRAASAECERALLCAALELTKGHLQKTADALGISRTTLRKKMAELKIEVEVDVYVQK